VKDKNEHILLYERQYEDILLDQSRKLRLRPFESIVLANYGGQL